MKKIFILTSFIFSCFTLFAQNDSISTRDTVQFYYAIKKNLIPSYQKILYFIADKKTSQNEVEEIINNNVKGNKDKRVFTDEKVVIEYDLKPGADTNKLDMDVVRYLNAFSTGYSKSDDPGITLNILRISPLKKINYFYYEVLFECSYSDTNSAGEKFNKFNRIAEIRLVNDKGWHAYINMVRFAKNNEPDTANVYRSIYKTETDVDKIISMYDDEAQRKTREDLKTIKLLLEGGDDDYDKGDYESALKTYKEARAIDIFNKDPKEKIEKVKKAIAEKNQKAKAEAEKKIHADEMKKAAVHEKNFYNFILAKSLCDSLIKDYAVNDPGIDSLSDQMSKIISSLSGIETAMGNRDIKDVTRKCEAKIKDAKLKNDIISEAEFEYRYALAYIVLDSAETKEIFLHLDNAVSLSEDHHQEALKERTKMNLRTGKISDAVEDATRIIGNDSRNADNYIFRADLYDRNKNYEKAIDDNGQAISLKTTDSTVYEKKSRLEFNTGKYSDAKKTASDGIGKTVCYGTLYFNRGLALDKLKDYAAAGDDFRKGKQCGIDEGQRAWIDSISAAYVSEGNAFFLKSDWYDARNSFTKAVAIDSNLYALYGRARTYITAGNNDSAITDLNKLLRRKPDVQDAHNQRAIAYSNLKNFTEANADFEDETKRFAANTSAWYAKGSSEIIQKKYADAALSFEHAAALLPVDSIWYKASYSYFNNQNYSKAIETAIKAVDKGTKMFQVYYISGRANYNLKNYKAAIKDFEAAKNLVRQDDDLFFWHAAALEAYPKYLPASQAYDLLYNSEKYKDTATFRSGVCLIKTRDDASYADAVRKFAKCYPAGSDIIKGDVYAWTAYAYLCMGSQKNADEFIGKAEKAYANDAMLLFVLACRNVKSNMYDDAFANLEKAIPALKLEKTDLDDEPLLKPLRKNNATKGRYEQILAKYFH